MGLNSKYSIALFVLCIIIGVFCGISWGLWAYGWFPYMRGAIGLVLAILGCIGAWKKNPGLLFITALGFLIVGCLAIVELILIIVETHGHLPIGAVVAAALWIAIYIVTAWLAYVLRSRHMRWTKI
jgi:hypothetical protein